MNRRDFLVQGSKVMLILPAAWVIGGCGPENDVQFTSSVIFGHSHRFTVNAIDLDQPSPAGISKDTSTDDGHTHRIELTEQDLAEIGAGQTVQKVTSEVAGHVHPFLFSRSTAVLVNGALV
jgi:hypothetical protein